MITIYKYPIDKTFVLEAPIIKPLHVDYQDGIPTLWAMVDTDAQNEEWFITYVGTGWNVSNVPQCINPDYYLNTTVKSSYPYVLHWFCGKLISSMDM